MGVRYDGGLVLGAVIYPIGRVLVTTLDGFCIVIGLKSEVGWVIGRRTESFGKSRAKRKISFVFEWSGLRRECVDCQQSERAARFERALDRVDFISFSESPRIQSAIARELKIKSAIEPKKRKSPQGT